jgi:hypothetical protein
MRATNGSDDGKNGHLTLADYRIVIAGRHVSSINKTILDVSFVPAPQLSSLCYTEN